MVPGALCYMTGTKLILVPGSKQPVLNGDGRMPLFLVMTGEHICYVTTRMYIDYGGCWKVKLIFKHLNDFKWKNSKLQSCRSHWGLQFSYKNYLHPSSYEKDMIFLRSNLVAPTGWRDKLYCHAGGSGVTTLTHGICAGRSLPSAPRCANVAHLVTPACGATTCFCRAMRTGATKRVRSVNICSDELFLK